MTPAKRQLLFMQIKDEVSVGSTLNLWLFKMETPERTMIWAALGLTAVVWLLSTTQVIPYQFVWLGLGPLAIFAYGLFRQSERYRLPYYKTLNIEKKKWAKRREVADRQRIRDSFIDKGLYKKEHLEAFTNEITAALETKHVTGLGKHPLYIYILGICTGPVVQSLIGQGRDLNPSALVVLIFALILTVTVVPLIYDIVTGERRRLRYLLTSCQAITRDIADFDRTQMEKS